MPRHITSFIDLTNRHTTLFEVLIGNATTYHFIYWPYKQTQHVIQSISRIRSPHSQE